MNADGRRQLVIGCVALAVAAALGPSARGQGVAAPQTDPAAIVQAQESQSAQLAATWLESGDARVRAWGAYVVLRDQRHALAPQLTGLATAYVVKTGPLGGTDRDAHDAMLSVLDAVIQMDGRMPADVSQQLYPEFPVQALILLSRSDPERASDHFLLDIFEKENTWTSLWLAAGNLLMNRTQCSWPFPNCRLKVAGFAAAVLGGLTVDAEVRVVDKASGPARPRGTGGSCPFGLPGPQTGWPPVGNYYSGRYGPQVLLVRGDDPSFYSRSVGGPDPDRSRVEVCPYGLSSRDTLREHFLAKLSGDAPGSPSVRSFVPSTISWRDDAQYVKDLRAFIDRQRGLFDRQRNKLLAAGLLDDNESARPTLDVRVSDDRSKKGARLPVLPNPGPNTKITSKS